MSFNPVFNPRPKTKVLTDEKKQFIYYLVDKPEEIYATVNIESNLDQNKVKFEILKYNTKYLQDENTNVFLKNIFFNILDLSFNNITIVNFPMDKKTWENCFKKLYEFVDNRIKINKGPKFVAARLKYINFTIKRTKKNHYIPQGYLKSFSSTPLKKSGNKRILVYDKEKGGLLERNGSNTIKIENIAFGFHFYSIRFEQILAKYIEPEYFRVIEKVLSTQSCKSLSLGDKISILKFILSLYLRTLDSRKYFKELTEESLKKFYSELCKLKGVDVEAHEIKVEYNGLLLRLKLEHMILDIISGNDSRFLEIYHKYLNMEWLVLKSSTIPFFTSDQPLILYSKKPIQEELMGDFSGYIRTISRFRSGLNEKNIQIYFPISPELCLNIISMENLTEQLDTQGIIEQLIIKSYLYLFLSEDNSDFIKEVIEKHPESLKKDGNRIKIEKLK